MAENFDNTPSVPLAKAVIPVEADLTEFKRQIEEAIDDAIAKLNEAIDTGNRTLVSKAEEAMGQVAQKLEEMSQKAAENFSERFSAAVSAASDQVADLSTRAGEVKFETPQPPPQEEKQSAPVVDTRDIESKLDDIKENTDSMRDSLLQIQAGIGNA